MKVTLDKIKAAQELLSKILPPTPLVKNEWLSKTYGCEVYLKMETAQPIGSFKIRGATYKISQLSEETRKKGVIAASAGNHAQGVAWGANYFKTNALIVMPETAPLTKLQNTLELGATIKQFGETYDESFQEAQKIMKESGRTYVHAFHDPDVVAGQGTVGLEILDQCPNPDYVVSSIGGGGLLAGLGLVFKSLSPKTKIIGCQAASSDSMVASLKMHELVQTEFKGTFADGIAVKTANPEMFEILDQLVYKTFESDDDEIAMNVLRFMEKAKVVVEGSGAIVLGALERFREEMAGKKVVLILSGGNIDVNLISRIIDKGLMRSGRRVHLRVTISDRPGSLSKLTSLIGAMKASILQAMHDRSEMSMKLDETEVELVLETKGPEHSAEVVAELTKNCKRVVTQ